MKRIQLKKLLTWQILLTIVLSLVLLIAQHDPINLLYLAILILSLLLERFGKENWTRIFNIITLPYVFIHVCSGLVQLLIKSFAGLNVFCYILYFIGMLLLLIPVSACDYGRIKKPFGQLLATIWLIINLFLSRSLAVSGSQFLVGLNKSPLLQALMLFEYAYLAITAWSYHFYFNLTVAKKNLVYYLFLLLLIAVTLWMGCFDAFSFSASSWGQAFWHWDFTLINPFDAANIKNFWQLCFTALDAGIMEESARYIFLLTLLAIFAKKKNRTLSAILISAGIFALLHILGFLKPGRTIISAAFQVLFAFGFGCILAVIFLYSGKLWLTMLLHALDDFLNMSVVPLGYSGSLLASLNNNLLFLVIINVVPLIFVAIILVSPVSRSFIEQNVKKITIFNV